MISFTPRPQRQKAEGQARASPPRTRHHSVPPAREDESPFRPTRLQLSPALGGQLLAPIPGATHRQSTCSEVASPPSSERADLSEAT